MNEKVICDKPDLVAIADMVREATGTTETFSVKELGTATAKAISNGGSKDAVLYTEQGLTVEQQRQARENIGAISEVDVPVKGVDYWTSADRESIVQDVIAALGTPVFGRVDADNNIILTGELVDGTYTVKYEDAEGNVTEIGTLTHSNAPEVTYTNLFDPATAEINTRMSGSSNAAKTENGYVMTATIYLPAAISITSTAGEHFIAVPAGMWANSANIFFGNTNGNAQGYNDVGGNSGVTVGNWTKIPLSNKRSTSISCDRIIVSLYVKGSSITASDIQNIGIYFNEIPE